MFKLTARKNDVTLAELMRSGFNALCCVQTDVGIAVKRR